jgi:hypothetical protein
VIIATLGFPSFRGGLLIADGAFHSRAPRCHGVGPRGVWGGLRGRCHAARSRWAASAAARSARTCS